MARMSDERFWRLMEKCREILSALQGQYDFPTQEREDMEQEMALALLQLSDEHTDSYCLSRAAWAALHWLRQMFGTQLVHGIDTMPHVAKLIDEGKCRRVWGSWEADAPRPVKGGVEPVHSKG